MPVRKTSALLFPAFLFVGTIYGQRAEPRLAVDSQYVIQPTKQPARIGEKAGIGPWASLRPATEVESLKLREIAEWNQAGRLPARGGFVRALPEQPIEFSSENLVGSSFQPYAGGVLSLSGDGYLVWAGQVQVENAYGLRLHLSNLRLPQGTRMWTYGSGQGRAEAVALELTSADGEIWCPTVFSEALWLEVEIPVEHFAAVRSYGFVVKGVAELLQSTFHQRDARASDTLYASTQCLVDGTCVTSSTLDSIELYRKAVGFVVLITGNNVFTCSGALLNTTTDSFAPYFLTANHCISTQAQASATEVYWDYRTAACNGVSPGLANLPKSSGSTLLATGSDSDFTLLSLSTLPAGSGRYFLGWDPNPVASGTILHRLSHPGGAAQKYSQSRVQLFPLTCTDAPSANYIYSTPLIGGGGPGSSGAPVIRQGGYVVGQLRGTCGPTPADGCDYANSHVDGAFSLTYPAIRQWLARIMHDR